jgi:hypothetical protein
MRCAAAAAALLTLRCSLIRTLFLAPEPGAADQRKLVPHPGGASLPDAPKTWPRAESGGAQRGAVAHDASAPLVFDAPGEGKGNSVLPEVRATDPGMDPRWPPVKRPGDSAAVVIESGGERKAEAGPVLLTAEEVQKHNTKDDCWVRSNTASFAWLRCAADATVLLAGDSERQGVRRDRVRTRSACAAPCLAWSSMAVSALKQQR